MTTQKTEAKEAVKTQSDAYKSFKILIEAYKEQNPAKYEIKKDELETKLNTL